MAAEKISLKEKISYGLGDTSLNIFNGITMMLMTVYFTDTFKLDPAIMGTLFLVARLIDGITDPLCGMLSDRVKSRHGRYRFFLLYFSVPFGVSCAALFMCPDLGPTGRTIYAYVTYLFLVLSVTLVSVPYVSLLGAISDDSNERLSINAIRFPLTKVAYIIVSLIVPSLLAMFDNQVVGYRVVMSGIGLLCIILVLICYANTKERIYTPVDDSVSMGEQIKCLFKNDQAIAMFLGQIFTMINNTLKFGGAAYFVSYVLKEGTASLSALLTAGSVAGILAPFAANYLLAKKYIKRGPLLVVSQLAGAVFLLAIGLIASSSIVLNTALFFLSLFCGELIAILVWASVADCGDYGYAKYGIRVTGIISGGMMFSTKLGMAIGGALLGYVLAFYGYDPDTASSATEDQLFAFVLLFSILPAIFMVLAAAAFKIYRLEEDVCESFKQDKAQA